ncbi:hypothetical protein Tco_0631291 [Tanacetum coccineum]
MRNDDVTEWHRSIHEVDVKKIIRKHQMRSDDVIEWRRQGVAWLIGVEVTVGFCWLLFEVGVEEMDKKK